MTQLKDGATSTIVTTQEDINEVHGLVVKTAWQVDEDTRLS